MGEMCRCPPRGLVRVPRYAQRTHGSFPLLPPVIGFTHEPGAVWQKMTGELDEAFERGLAAELALLHYLGRNRAYKYVFLEHFERR
jgi:hypothetical protein